MIEQITSVMKTPVSSEILDDLDMLGLSEHKENMSKVINTSNNER